MKIDSNYGELAAINHEITRHQKASLVFALFNRQTISDFYSRNAIRLKLLSEKIAKLVELYVEHDDKGAAVMDTEKPGMYKYKTPEDEKAFNAQWEEFSATSITINI